MIRGWTMSEIFSERKMSKKFSGRTMSEFFSRRIIAEILTFLFVGSEF